MRLSSSYYDCQHQPQCGSWFQKPSLPFEPFLPFAFPLPPLEAPLPGSLAIGKFVGYRDPKKRISLDIRLDARRPTLPIRFL